MKNKELEKKKKKKSDGETQLEKVRTREEVRRDKIVVEPKQ